MNNPTPTPPEEKTFFGIIIHSFFVIPFFIAVSAVVLFAAMHWLTREQLTAYDYLEQVKIGGLTKRWQAAFELSKILANPKLIPVETRFSQEIISVFEGAKNDDTRVRQYLALAMAKTGHPEFLTPLIEGLASANEETQRTFIYALGMMRDKRANAALLQYLDDKDSRVRSMSVAALGTIGDANIAPALRKMLHDSEPNVQWTAAIALANFADASGKNILKQLLNRNYLAQYSEVDPQEQTQIVLQAINASNQLNDPELTQQIRHLTTTDPSMNVRSQALAALNHE